MSPLALSFTKAWHPLLYTHIHTLYFMLKKKERMRCNDINKKGRAWNFNFIISSCMFNQLSYPMHMVLKNMEMQGRKTCMDYSNIHGLVDAAGRGNMDGQCASWTGTGRVGLKFNTVKYWNRFSFCIFTILLEISLISSCPFVGSVGEKVKFPSL